MCHLGFLLFAMTLMLLVAVCVSPSKFRVFVVILTMVNMTWVAHLASFSGVALPLGSCVQLRRSVCTRCSRKNRHTLSRFQITRRTSLCFVNPLKILAALVRQRDACTLVLAVNVRDGPNTQDRAEHLTAAPGHPFEDVMATCHPPVMLEMLRKHHPTNSVPSNSSGRNTVVCSSAEKRMCIVFSLEAREGPNAQDKAERLMVATGHFLEDMIALLRQRNT